MADAIPMGQPILVGHHSEKRDRRYRDRIQGTLRKAHEAQQEAERLEHAAHAAAVNPAISSDDPEAVKLLREKLLTLEKFQALAVKVNAIVRRHKANPAAARGELAALGLNPVTIENALTPDFMGRLGVPDYSIKNNGAEIRRVKARIEELLEAAAAPATPPETYGDVRIEESDNRVRIHFPGKPAEAVRSRLKADGFRWSPTEGAWQRMASNQAWYRARMIVQSLQGGV
jgi:hypothetical protein